MLLNSMDTTERDAGVLLLLYPAESLGQPGRGAPDVRQGGR
jgi:hypothetical protein